MNLFDLVHLLLYQIVKYLVRTDSVVELSSFINVIGALNKSNKN